MKHLKDFQYWIHKHYDLIKLILLGTILGLGVMTIINLQNAETQRNQNDKQFSKDIIAVARENQSIAKQNRSYTRCIAEVFAKYTRDQLPITNLNLDTCTSDSQTIETDHTESGGTAPADAAPNDNTNDVQRRSGTPTTEAPVTPTQTNEQSATPQQQTEQPSQELNVIESIIKTIQGAL